MEIGRIVVDAPPKPPAVTPVSPLARLMPAAMIVAMAGMTVLYLTSTDTAGRSPMFMFFPAMMLLSLIGTLVQGSRGSGRGGELSRGRADYLRYLGTLDAALAVARQRVGPTAATARLAVVAMGKCGGHELNYVSDVDVIFVHEPVEGADDAVALKAAAQLASHLMRVCSEHTSEGTIWPVDAALRPEGSAGPLTRTLASHQGYYCLLYTSDAADE